jgi:hypothetical protein
MKDEKNLNSTKMDQRGKTPDKKKIPGRVHVGFVVDKVLLGQIFAPSTSVFPCQFYSTGAPLQGKTKKTDHLHHRVAQSVSRLRCVLSICCGALLK